MFSSTLPLSRTIAIEKYLRDAPGGRFGAESLSADTSRLIAERRHQWWVVGISQDALDDQTYLTRHLKHDPELAPVATVRTFLASPDFTTWANRVGAHVHLPLDRPTDRAFHHVVINRGRATGPLVIHPSIRSLMVDLGELSSADVNALVGQLPGLENLERLSVVEGRDSGRLRAIVEALPPAKLRDVHLRGNPRPLAEVAGRFPALTRLSIQYDVPSEVRASVVDGTLPSPLEGLSQSKSLEFLRIFAPPARDGFLYGPAGIDELVATENLRVLELPESGVTDAHVRKIATMTKLESLNVNHHDRDGVWTLFGTGFTDYPGGLTDDAIATLSQSGSLRRLAVAGQPRITSRSHSVFANWERLTHLVIEHLGEGDVLWLAQMPSLRHLAIFSPDNNKAVVTPAELALIAKSDSLRFIDVGRELTTGLVKAVRNMKQLHALRGEWTRIDPPSHLHAAAPKIALIY